MVVHCNDVQRWGVEHTGTSVAQYFQPESAIVWSFMELCGKWLWKSLAYEKRSGEEKLPERRTIFFLQYFACICRCPLMLTASSSGLTNLFRRPESCLCAYVRTIGLAFSFFLHSFSLVLNVADNYTEVLLLNNTCKLHWHYLQCCKCIPSSAKFILWQHTAFSKPWTSFKSFCALRCCNNQCIVVSKQNTTLTQTWQSPWTVFFKVTACVWWRFLLPMIATISCTVRQYIGPDLLTTNHTISHSPCFRFLGDNHSCWQNCWQSLLCSSWHFMGHHIPTAQIVQWSILMIPCTHLEHVQEEPRLTLP